MKPTFTWRRSKATFLRRFQKAMTICAAAAMLLPTTAALFYAGRLPDEFHIRRGECLHITSAFPIEAVPIPSAAQAAQLGSTPQTASLRLFGIFPIKNVRTQPTEEVMLVPCGAPFGVRMLMGGVMVIGFGEVASADGHCCPAVDAGLAVGDVIIGANQTEIRSTADFRAAAKDGQTLDLTVMRGSTLQEISLTPAYSLTEGCCQTGLWVRDSAAGIGTLTYFEPETGRFGGLGHPICDPDTGELIPLAQGEADAVTISGVVRGQAGLPGQLQGYFAADAPIGTLFCNSEAGVFGTLDVIPDLPAVPMALQQEVETGEAVILATLEGDAPEPFTAEILSLDYASSTRNMVIRVTDPRLLEAAGGIVQGMSGSPILQNGRLVGAVTHVFVSDPSQGYGIFAEHMYAYTQSAAAIP
ncbi:MAG: SpoIVB peptidase [Oscillospiraceae bacterium]|nr:SpoIVB peptidase [Oscillospiraceae bacterium]